MEFRSTSARSLGDDEYELEGDLTINGITTPVTLDVQFNGMQNHPMDGKLRVGFDATTEIRRGDYGIDFNVPLSAGALMLGEKVKVELDLQFLPAEAQSA